MHERDRAQVLSDLHVTSKASPGTGSKGRARATVTRRLRTIAGFYKYTVEEELLEHHPFPILARSWLSAEVLPGCGLMSDGLRRRASASRASARTDLGPAPARATDGEPSTVPGASSGPGQWRVIEDDYLGAFVGSGSWCAACVHGGTVHGPGGSSGGGAAAWGAGMRARLSNKTPPAAAAATAAERSGSRSRTPRPPATGRRARPGWRTGRRGRMPARAVPRRGPSGRSCAGRGWAAILRRSSGL